MRTDTPDALQLVVHEIEAGVRPVRLRLPFRFGAVTLNAAPQLFVRAQVEVAGRGMHTGHAAELMVPKWFDKRAGRSLADNVSDLAASVQMARAAYMQDKPAAPFDLYARHAGALQRQGASDGLTELGSAYGQAVIDRAVLDAVCRALGVSFFDAITHNLVGLHDTPLTPELHGLDWNAWLAELTPLHTLTARHTVGMLDELHHAAAGGSGDDLPRSLPAVIARYGNRVFKIKLGGQPTADAARLAEVLDVLDRHAPGHRYTLDGNEQYTDAAALSEFFAQLSAVPAYARRPNALLYIEQPVARERSFDIALPAGESPAPLLMDEADGTLDAFVRGRELGWRGVSSKGCKGMYKALVNRARCRRWNDAAAVNEQDAPNARYFMSAEDLTCQAGLAVQQDLALAAMLGLTHCERNGHHYADGFGDAPGEERQAFAAAHGDLYDTHDGHTRLAIRAGRIAIDSLFAPGFAHSADPDWRAMQPLADATTMV